MNLEETCIDETVTITDTERELLLSKKCELTSPQMTAFLVYKQASLKLNATSDWFDIVKYQNSYPNGKIPFWIKLRDEILQVCQDRNMAVSTTGTTLRVIRRIIKELHPELDKQASQYIVCRSEKKESTRMSAVDKLHPDSTYAIFMKEFKRVIPLRTRQKSEESIKITMQDMHNLATKLDIDKMLNEENDLGTDTLLEAVNSMFSSNVDLIKQYLTEQLSKPIARYIVIFKHIFNNKKLVEVAQEIASVKTANASIEAADNEEDGDIHRLSPKEVESMKDQIKTTLDALIFYILFTTGLRAGGLARIKMGDVASYDASNGWTLKSNGKTLEKGKKIRHFPIAQCVNEHLLKWLTEDRPFVQSSYLFPGQYANTHMTPDNIARLFKRMATAAGIQDERAHTHVARHTVGFMLAERGNSMEYIAKFLGHASPKTTEAYYVKFSTNELCDRMDIPWLSDTLKTAIQPTPPCLTVQKEEPSTSTDINDGKRKTDKELRREQKAAKKQKLQSTLNTIMSLQQQLCSQ